MSIHVERVPITEIQVGDVVWSGKHTHFEVNNKLRVQKMTWKGPGDHIKLTNSNNKQIIRYESLCVLRISPNASQTTITVHEVPLSQVKLDDVVWCWEGQDWLQVKNIRQYVHEMIENGNLITREVTKIELNDDEECDREPFLKGEPTYMVLVK